MHTKDDIDTRLAMLKTYDLYGFKMVKLNPESKNPNYRDWPKLDIPLLDVCCEV